jgi:hypothetical protein
MWLVMAPVLPMWLLVKHFSDVARLWRPALAIALPFPIVWLIGTIWPWLGDRWLFFAEWVALSALVIQYLRDAKTHADDPHVCGVENLEQAD